MPITSEFIYTPQQIKARLTSETLDSERRQMQRSFEGLSVDWRLPYWKVNLVKDPEKQYWAALFWDGFPESPVVLCRIPLDGNEHFQLNETGRDFRIRGFIEEAGISTITLRHGATAEALGAPPRAIPVIK
jgi:hypothetical protein